MKKYAVAVDIGGTNTRVALIDEDFVILNRAQFRTNADDPEATLSQIADIITQFPQKVLALGISCPGPLDLPHGTILTPPNLHGLWHHYPIVKNLSNRLHLPVFLNNDANLAALAEAVLGAGKNFRYVQFLTISTGIGAGFVMDKQIHIGAHGFGNEVANCIMMPQGPKQGDLLPGALESICSGTAITTLANAAGLNVAHAGEVAALAHQGNRDAQEIITNAQEYLANFIAFVYGFADPDIVILGGSVALKIDGYVETVEQLVKDRVYDVLKPHIRIEKSTLNEDSGLLGSAYYALQKIG